MKLKGTITINRSGPCSADPKKNRIVITIRDERSFCNAVEVEMRVEDFAMALTGLGSVECAACDFNDSGVIGKKHECKTELVPFESDKCGDARIPLAKKALKPFEVDGWMGRVDDLSNNHRRKGNGYEVTFHRYVPVTENPR